MSGTGRLMRGVAAAGLALALVACAGEAPQDDGTGPANTEVVGAQGDGGLQTFQVRVQGKRLQVKIYNRGEGARTAVVSARNIRGLDQADVRIAYDAAYQAGTQIDCGGGAPMEVLPDSAIFQEEGRRSAFTNGEAAWVFQARCG